MDMLPQIILATIDYSEFADELTNPSKIITLTEQRKLLSEEVYSSNHEEINNMLELMEFHSK